MNLTTPQITSQHSLTTETLRLLFTANRLAHQQYQNRGFQILPKLPSTAITQNLVIFPLLNYQSIPNFWHQVYKLKATTPIKAPTNLINQTKQLLRPIYHSSVYTQFLSKFNDVNRIFPTLWTKLINIFPKYQDSLKHLFIYPTQFGTISSFNLSNQSDQAHIFLRLDSNLNEFLEAILTFLLRPKLEQLKYTWTEIEAIIDFLVIELNFSSNSTRFQGTIPTLRRHQQGPTQQQSQHYLQQLGLDQLQLWEIKNHQIYYNHQKLKNLSHNEQKLLEVLIAKSPKIATFNEIIDHVWPNNYEITQWAVTKLVQRLRQKLHQNNLHLPLIQTHRRHGYSLI